MKSYYKIFSLLSFLLYGMSFSQQWHIRYKNIRSVIMTVNEDLYFDIQRNKLISIQDSIGVHYNDGKYQTKHLPYRFHFMSSLSDSSKKKEYLFTGYAKKQMFLVEDEVSVPIWTIDEKDKKTILGYQCTKATAVFRGTPVVAYFTSQIPYSVGPFKFYGLPGAILEVYAEGKSYYRWKAESITSNSKENINFTPSFDYPKITIKELVSKEDEVRNSMDAELHKSLPAGTSIIAQPKIRLSLETKYEWEE